MSTATPVLPALPAREDVQNITSKLDGLAVASASLGSVLTRRQLAAYSLPQSNEVSEVFANHSVTNIAIEGRVDAVVQEDDSFWAQYLRGQPAEHAEEVEAALLAGIPSAYKGLVYLKTLDVKYQLSRERYNNMLNKSRFAELPFGDLVEAAGAVTEKTEAGAGADSSAIVNALNVVNYYVHVIVDPNSQKLDLINSSNELNSNESADVFPYVVLAARALAGVLLLEIELVYVLLKVYKMLLHVNFEELYYEISRAIEDLVPQAFETVVLQGIRMTEVLPQQVKAVLSLGRIDVLELMLFQGLGCLTRVFVQLYSNQEMPKDGSELALLLTSGEFVESLSIEKAVTYEPDIIKYENEYYLININLLSNNSYELMNSLEINKQLQHKITELNGEIDNLKTTHEEIIQQSQEYEQEITEKEKVNQQLEKEHLELKTKFERLTMKDNLDNTIQANREFCRRNEELEQQIEGLRKAIEEKRAKLGRYEGATGAEEEEK